MNARELITKKENKLLIYATNIREYHCVQLCLCQI